MNKVWAIMMCAILVIGSIPVYGEISERELRTLEGTYQFEVQYDNIDNANGLLKQSYNVSQALTADLITHTFTLDIKFKDGEMILYDRGNELDRGGMSADNSMYFLEFYYEVPGASIPGIGYYVDATVSFDDSTKSFDIIVPERTSLIFIKNEGGEKSYGYLVNGTVNITKVGSGLEVEEEVEAETEEGNTLAGKPMALTFVKGLVQVKRAGSGEVIRARRNMILNPGDTVYTGKGSYADLGSQAGEFAIGGHDLSMNPLSVFTVPVEKVEVPKKSRLRVFLEDTVDNAAAMLKDPEDFEIETPSAVTGIRGTDYWIIVDEEGNTEILLNEGSVYVESKFDGTSVLLEPGQKVSVAMNASTSETESMTDEDRQLFEEVDYDSIPDYYPGLGEEETVADIENYETQADEESDEELPSVIDDSEEGSGMVVWIIAIAVLAGAFFIIKKVIKKK